MAPGEVFQVAAQQAQRPPDAADLLVASVVDDVDREGAKQVDAASSREALDSEHSLAAIGEQLIYAQAMGRRWKRRFHLPLLATGSALFLPGSALLFTWSLGSGTQAVTSVLLTGSGMVAVGGLVMLLAVLPTDRVTIKWVARAWIALSPVLLVQELAKLLRNTVIECCEDSRIRIPRSVANAHIALSCVAMLSWVGIIIWFGRRMRERPARVLECIWTSSGGLLLSISAYSVINAPLVWPYNPAGPGARPLYGAVLNPVLYFLLGLMCCCRGPRERVRAYLAWRGGQATPVVRIAELLGQKPIQETLASALASFRCVSGDQVSCCGLADNSTNARLQTFTAQAHFGRVDAFVSHSWRDDSEAKWAALQNWCAEFRRRHGREPLLWVDKYCIDPVDLHEGLRCLPLYVVGCRTLLVLCGPTYLERAWCLLEVFVFLAMGGTPDNVEVEFFLPSMYDLAQVIEAFDAARATCTFEADTVRLQEVFTLGGCSSAEGLTDAVKGVLRAGVPN